VAHAQDEAVAGHARVVDEHADRAPCRLDLGEAGVDTGYVGDVDADGHGLALLAGRPAHGNAVAVARQRHRHGPADAAGATSDERGLHRVTRSHVAFHRSTALPHAMPAPKPDTSTTSPSLMRPPSAASLSAI